MKNRFLRISWAIPMLVGLSSTVVAVEGGRTLQAKLTGFEQVPTVITTGSGRFVGTLNEAHTAISYSLTFSNIQGEPIEFADIHVGQRLVNGGISVFLCSTTPPATTTPPSGTQLCPSGASGTITGTITAADIIGPAGQGIPAGNFAKLVQAIQHGDTYVQMHTTKFATGELRGQIGTE